MRFPIKKMTYEDRFDRHYACYWKRGAKAIKTANRRLFRRLVRKDTEQSIKEYQNENTNNIGLKPRDH